MLLSGSFVAAALVACASAATLTVSLPPSPPLLPNPAALPPSTHAILLGAPGVRHDAPIRRDNTIHFSALSPGSYLLTLYSRDLSFPPFRVDVTASADGLNERIEAWQTFRGNEWENKGPSYGSANTGDLKVDVRPNAPKDFYQARGGFNLLGFLKSPMILMGLVSVVMIFGMPYIMDNMDPETKKEFEEMQKSSPLTGSSGAANQIQNFDIAGFLAGKSSSTDAAGGGGTKKR